MSSVLAFVHELGYITSGCLEAVFLPVFRYSFGHRFNGRHAVCFSEVNASE